MYQAEDWDIEAVDDAEELKTRLKAEDVRLTFIPVDLENERALKLLSFIRAKYPSIAVVGYTTSRDLRPAVKAMRKGALDVLGTPLQTEEIHNVFDRVENLFHDHVEGGGEYDLHIEQAQRGLRYRRISMARSHVGLALEIDPGRPEAYNLQGILQEIDGDLGGAQKSYWKALQIDPEYQPAVNNLHQSVERGREGSFLLGEVKTERLQDSQDGGGGNDISV